MEVKHEGGPSAEVRAGRRRLVAVISDCRMTSHDDDCIFCRIASGEIPSASVYEDDRVVVFMDANPATRGHVLVVPRQHSADLHAIAPDDLAACWQVARRVAAQLVERLEADGVNVLNATGRVAGQTVFHFHLHVIPRYAGDGIQDPLPDSPGDPAEIAAVAAAIRGEGVHRS